MEYKEHLKALPYKELVIEFMKVQGIKNPTTVRMYNAIIEEANRRDRKAMKDIYGLRAIVDFDEN